MARPAGGKNLTPEERYNYYEKVRKRQREKYHKDKQKYLEYQSNYYKAKCNDPEFKKNMYKYQHEYYIKHRDIILKKRQYAKEYRLKQKKQKYNTADDMPSGNYNSETKKFLIEF